MFFAPKESFATEYNRGNISVFILNKREFDLSMLAIHPHVSLFSFSGEEIGIDGWFFRKKRIRDQSRNKVIDEVFKTPMSGMFYLTHVFQFVIHRFY